MKITVNMDQWNQDIAKLSSELADPIPGLNVAGRAVANALKKHFRSKQDNEPNKLRGKRTNFWDGVARSVTPSGGDPERVDANTVRVTVGATGSLAKILMHKLRGGTIVPKRAKYLTIPVHPLAYGVTASHFGKRLQFAFTPQGRALVLAQNMQSRRYSWGGAQKDQQVLQASGATGTILYLLRKKVTQAARPNTLPSEQTLATAARQGFSDWLDFRTKKGGKNG